MIPMNLIPLLMEIEENVIIKAAETMMKEIINTVMAEKKIKLSGLFLR